MKRMDDRRAPWEDALREGLSAGSSGISETDGRALARLRQIYEHKPLIDGLLDSFLVLPFLLLMGGPVELGRPGNPDQVDGG